MIIQLKVFEQTLSIVYTKSIPRQGSKDYLVLQFLFSSDWKDLDKLCYLQHGEVSQPIDVVDNLVEVPEWFTEQDSFDVTLFGKSGNREVPTNVVSLRLEKSNTLWEQDAPEPQPSWLAKVIELNNHPPIPGENGYWMLWNTDKGAYVESELPLPDVDAIDKYNGMTPVECVFPPWFDGGPETSKTLYVKQGVINPVDYKTVTDDIKTAWLNLTFLTDATNSNLSSYRNTIKGIAPLIEFCVFGEDFFNTVTWDSSCVFFDDPITQSKKITIWTSSASTKSFGIKVDGPNGYSASDSYSILNDEFNGNGVVRTTLCTVSDYANDTSSKLYQREMAAAPTKDMHIATKKYVDDSVSNPLSVTGATVGQIAKITAVDGSGKPTAWEAVDMPTGGGETWEAINAITLSDAINTVTINTDSGGNAIALKKVRILVEGSATHNQDLFFNNSRYIRTQVVGTAASVGALSAEPFCGKMYCFAVINITANYAANGQFANVFSDEITITEIKLIVNNSGTFSAGTKFTIQGVRA